MKKYVILLAVIVIVLIGIIYLVYLGDEENIVYSFEIPSEDIPKCYPIKITDYRQVTQNDGNLMIFGRAVWSKNVNNDLDGRPAVVPIEIYMKNEETGEFELIETGKTNPKDGHIVFIISDPEKKYMLKINFKNAENCPEKFRFLDGL